MIKLIFIVVALGALLPAATHGQNDQPILAVDYARDVMKQGFATNYFKTDPPAKKYREQNIKDVHDRGFRNLRLRCRADLYDAPYETNTKFDDFLEKLETVVDKCLVENVIPIISWIHHEAEANATDAEKQNYISWWTLVADRLKGKDYRLSFNLFTELGVDTCKPTGDCSRSLRRNTAKYNEWTKAVVAAIRGTGGNNDKRILILASPEKEGKGLSKIDPTIYTNEKYMMAEFHLYANGPNKLDSPKFWEGDGTGLGQSNVIASTELARQWTAVTKIPLYFGAWMANDVADMALDQTEMNNFVSYFVLHLKQHGIPWSLNVLDRYYDTQKSEWIVGKQTVLGKDMNYEMILDTILPIM